MRYDFQVPGDNRLIVDEYGEDGEKQDYTLICKSCKQWIVYAGEYYQDRSERITANIRRNNQQEKVKKYNVVDISKADKSTILAALAEMGIKKEES